MGFLTKVDFMKFVDTHTHLYDEAFEDGGTEAVARAIGSGVDKMIFPDIDKSSRQKMFDLAAKFPENAFPCIGLHPTSIDSNWKQEYELVLACKGRTDIVAIGEIGIDCYWSTDFIKEQMECFRLQLELSLELGLPVIIHSREATARIFEVLDSFRGRGLKGVFHAFGGSIETFREFDKYGDWMVGIGGTVTFKKASIAQTIKEIPLDRILTETDSPYLTPSPHRGTRNESSYIPIIARKIAEVKGISLEKVAETTTDNAFKLFRL